MTSTKIAGATTTAASATVTLGRLLLATHIKSVNKSGYSGPQIS